MKNVKGFAGPDGASFEPKDSSIFILPVPYDGTSTWIKGADKGPLSIIEASSELEMYDLETGTEVCEKGIHTCPALDVDCPPEEMVERVKKTVLEHIDQEKFTVVLGGEHSVSIGSIWAHASRFFDMSVLQLDAHSDMRDEYMGSRYNHACVIARAREVSKCVQVGVRSVSKGEIDIIQKDHFFPAHEIMSSPGWEHNVMDALTDNVYVSIDLDVFDPSYVPATGTPQPGGLDWYQVTGLLREVAEKKNVVGFDVVELCPHKENRAPDLLAAKLVYKFLSYIYASRAKKDRD